MSYQDVCVCNLGFIVIGLNPSNEPSAHLRWHTLSPVKMPLCGAWLEFLILIGAMFLPHRPLDLSRPSLAIRWPSSADAY